jgi:predicted transcriptional regulator
MADDDVTQRLDTIIALIKLAHRDNIAKSRAEIRADKIDAAILDLATEWTPSAKLQAAVAKKTGKSARAIRDHLPELAAQGLIEQRGGGRTTEYRSTGLI